MNIINSLFATYPQGVDLQLSDFTYSLSLQNPNFGITLATLLITFILGFLVYVYSFVLVIREKSAPYPLWMHTFYCAADFMGIWVFLAAYQAVGGFWFFMLGAVVFCFAIYDVVVYAKLPKKPEVLESGKKPIW